jgi:hypothetical protein
MGGRPARQRDGSLSLCTGRVTDKLLVVVAIIGLIASVTYWQQLSAAVKFLAGH